MSPPEPINQHALTNSYTTSPMPTPICVPPISALKLTLLNPCHSSPITRSCIPGPIVTAFAVPVLALELADTAPMPNICRVQSDVTSDGVSPQKRVRDVREKDRESGARASCFGSEAERAMRWVGGGRGDEELEVVVKGVKVV